MELKLIVEAHVPDHDPIGNLQGTIILTKLGLNFNHGKTNSAMTHILVLNALVRRNEWSK